MKSLCDVKQNINSIFPAADNKSHFDLPPTFNKLQSPEVVVTVPVRPNSVQYGTVPLSLIPDTLHNNTVPEVAYGTCTVPNS